MKRTDLVLNLVPQVFCEQRKAMKSAPNGDVVSATLKYCCGVREFDFYTVLLGVGNALGVTVNYGWGACSASRSSTTSR